MKKLKIQGLAHKLNRLSILTAVAAVALAGSCASAQIVTNGYFGPTDSGPNATPNEDNDSSFSGYAGYANSEGDPMIAGWTSNNTSAGLNGTDIYFDRVNSQYPMGHEEQESQFAPRGYSFTATNANFDPAANPPRDFVFLQDGGTTLTQTLTLTPFTSYTLTFLSATRNGYGFSTGSVSASGSGLTYSVDTPPQAATAGFSSYTLNFDTHASGTIVLTLANTSSTTLYNDTAVDFANIVVTQSGVAGTVDVPEPTSFGFLGLGALALLLAGRRRMLNS